MAFATFPLNLYSTRRAFNDCGADDMRYGDMSAHQLVNEFGLTHVSNVVNPFTLTRLQPFHNPQSRFAGYHAGYPGQKLSREACAALLFAEMKTTSLPFALVGPQRFLINNMLDHLQRSSGMPFRDSTLNMAYRDRIINDNGDSSTHRVIKEFLSNNIDYNGRGLPIENLSTLKKLISDTVLPKFDSFSDRINGLGITVHDIHATRIDLISMKIRDKEWRAKIKYSGQDHFGLDKGDINKAKFRQFQFFKIWFTLQRYSVFGYRPFLTEMETIVDIEGRR